MRIQCGWLTLGAVMLAAGCGPQQEIMSGRLDQGLVIVLPGVEGRSPLNEGICNGLAMGGVKSAVCLYDWTGPWGPIHNLRSQERNRDVAGDIAWEIHEYHRKYPGRPVVLVGQSGGGAMAVWVTEAMTGKQSVDGIVLLDAALSPEYPLDTALMRCRRGIVNFYSTRDWFLLGVGTTIAGTMDGEHTSSAGRVGFTVPRAGGRPTVYKRLFQIGWSPEMARTGHWGIHVTSGADKFVQQYVVPLVNESRWDKDLITRIVSGTTSRPSVIP